VPSIANVGTSAHTTSSKTTDRLPGELSIDQFLKILISELKNQNPLEPMKNTELMAQMTQVKNLEATTQLTEELGRLKANLDLGSAASLIGKLVRGNAADGTKVEGRAEGLVIEDGKVKLVVNNSPLLPLENVEQVAEEVSGNGS
jgi:flagellar basal-body rod modification protein FlgD